MAKVINKRKKEILEFLKLGYKLNVAVAYRELGLHSAQLYYIIYTLKKEGWDIQTSSKPSKFSKNRYVEYYLNPKWRYVDEIEKREAIKSSKQSLSIRDLRIDDRVETKCGMKGSLTQLSSSGMCVLQEDTTDRAILISLDEIVKKLKNEK